MRMSMWYLNNNSSYFLRASLRTNYCQSRTWLSWLIVISEGELIFRKLYFQICMGMTLPVRENNRRNAFTPLAYSDFMQAEGKVNTWSGFPCQGETVGGGVFLASLYVGIFLYSRWTWLSQGLQTSSLCLKVFFCLFFLSMWLGPR